MTDKKFTDEEIIKALECCVKGETTHDCLKLECPFSKDLSLCFTCTKMALGLINRQKAEIERLKECPKCVYEYDGEMTEYCVQGPCSNFKTVAQIKAEAYKKFANITKKNVTELWDYDNDTFCPVYVLDKSVDNLLKEMVGEEE